MYKYVCINTNPLKSQVCLSPTQILFFFANSNHWPPSRSSRLGRKHVSPGGQGSKGPEMHGVDIGVFFDIVMPFLHQEMLRLIDLNLFNWYKFRN